mmetsp:Transcript_7521/g.19128  ORF Transcript_7521/g.19128 Transcript_7521/m.19128 type:complete len:283 (+) Transcript_7521:230-1078(+)|eukprot:CAMPEP_0197575176 /NCGR_PEP_ID=MMETSP1326-20131121/657_1 /TAXON_ID=1155430 /ORGANISM="Genus nov. species nov., Strain RCC2288" /LENGTH=282 /DNA_ID=CAMNT_0043137891 /DNA_START=225 /DNA_END=1073 /DNA_ORIENTATION=-
MTAQGDRNFQDKQNAHAFLSLPRLAGRLTAELIVRSDQGLNASKEYQIDLRGNKIASIENLGATQNQFDTMDLSDNEIVKLEGFPLLTRLHTLLLNNNRIARVGKDLQQYLPMLNSLVLTNNRLNNLADVDPLVNFKHLRHLSLMGNPLTKQANYRLYVVHTLPQLKVLDFRKVKPGERVKAKELFGGGGVGVSGAEGEEAAGAAGGARSAKRAKTFTPGTVGGDGAEAMDADDGEEPKAAGPTPQQLLALRAAIANAATLEEIARLESALTSGILPSDMKL